MEIPNNLNHYFDTEMLHCLLEDTSILWKMSWKYQSNWRILHIDGFEGGIRLPVHTGSTIQFFNYEEK